FPYLAQFPAGKTLVFSRLHKETLLVTLFDSVVHDCQEGRWEVILHRLRNPLHIQGIMTKAIDVGDEVGTEHSQSFGINPLPFRRELANDFGPMDHIMKDDQVPDEMIVLDDLALFIASILGDNPLAAKEEPFEKAV